MDRIPSNRTRDDTPSKTNFPDSESVPNSSGTSESKYIPKKRKRRSENRSRKGCLTCKKRRVKCDGMCII